MRNPATKDSRTRDTTQLGEQRSRPRPRDLAVAIVIGGAIATAVIAAIARGPLDASSQTGP